MGWEDWKVVRTWCFVHLPVDPAAGLRSVLWLENFSPARENAVDLRNSLNTPKASSLCLLVSSDTKNGVSKIYCIVCRY